MTSQPEVFICCVDMHDFVNRESICTPHATVTYIHGTPQVVIEACEGGFHRPIKLCPWCGVLVTLVLADEGAA